MRSNEHAVVFFTGLIDLSAHAFFLSILFPLSNLRVPRLLKVLTASPSHSPPCCTLTWHVRSLENVGS